MRRVRTLRLTAPEQSLIRRGNLLVEDALRTASLPEADCGRLIVVRSLDIGAIQAGAAPSRVALAIERSFVNLRALAVHALNPAASGARVVYFADGIEAHTLLAARLARGERADAWFWPVAVRAFRAEVSREEALRAILFSAVQNTPSVGQLAGVMLLHELLRQNAADPLLAGLRWQDGVALARAYGWSTADRLLPLESSSVFASPAFEVPPIEDRLIRRWATTWGVADARSTWLAASVLAGTNPIRLADPRLVVHAQRLLMGLAIADVEFAADSQSPPAPPVSKEVVASSPPRPLASGAVAIETPPPPGGYSSVLPPGQHDDAPLVADAAAAVREEVTGVQDHNEEEERDQDDEEAPAHPTSIVDPVPTEYAGIYFVLRLLQRLGIEAAVHSNTELIELRLPTRILRRLATRLRIPDDDPVLWPLADLELRPDLDHVLDEWLDGSRRLCRRVSRMGLSALVRRHGGISFTRTHIDIMFSLHQVDIRLRRAGLDLDPGWLPWFGRVVMFHYVSSQERQ